MKPPPRTPSKAGFKKQTIAGRYETLRLVGQGGAAEVFEARDHTLNRVVALKLLKPREISDPAKMGERFRREAEALALFVHPNIVRVYDYGQTEEGTFFIAMEFVAGDTLADLLESGAVSLKRGLNMMAQVCDALSYAHGKGVVHRDLKPGNIMISEEEHEQPVKLVDFGLAKALEDGESLTQMGLVLGTERYMAPEQRVAGAVDERTDIYAVGVILYRIITGTWPDDHKTPGNDSIPKWSDVRPDLRVPERLEDVVRRCLQRKPERRYENVDRLRRHLLACAKVPPSEYIVTSAVPTVRPGTLATLSPVELPQQPPPRALWKIVVVLGLTAVIASALLTIVFAMLWVIITS